MFRSTATEFLLCYDCLYLLLVLLAILTLDPSLWHLRRPVCHSFLHYRRISDDCSHGEPNRDYQAIEWEGRPDSVAFHPPYLLLISAPFVEIRHIDNAKLLQIYTGSDIRLTWEYVVHSSPLDTMLMNCSGTGGMARPFNDNPGPKYVNSAVTKGFCGF